MISKKGKFWVRKEKEFIMLRKKGNFQISRVLVVCACALLVYSFVALDITPTPPTEEFGFKDGNQGLHFLIL